MSGARDHLDRRDEGAGRAAATRPAEPVATPAIANAADPRLAHAGSGTGGDLLHLQRTVGNAAVSSLVAPTVQREIEIDEVSSEVAAADGPAAGPDTGPGAAPDATAAGPDATAAGPVSQSGGSTTISGAMINLAAPVTQAEGILRADTIVANSVIASSYTPGAGNEW